MTVARSHALDPVQPVTRLAVTCLAPFYGPQNGRLLRLRGFRVSLLNGGRPCCGRGETCLSPPVHLHRGQSGLTDATCGAWSGPCPEHAPSHTLGPYPGPWPKSHLPGSVAPFFSGRTVMSRPLLPRPFRFRFLCVRSPAVFQPESFPPVRRNAAARPHAPSGLPRLWFPACGWGTGAAWRHGFPAGYNANSRRV